MHIVKSYFSDFESYYEMAIDWELDHKLLTNIDFSAYLDMYSNSYFQLSQTKLNGKIDQFGLTPKGYRSIVIPVNYDNTYYWLNKKVSGNQLLIFPKCRTLDAVVFEGFNVFVVDVKESYLLEMLDKLGYHSAKKLFSNDEQYINLTQDFAKKFNYLASKFLAETRIQYSKGGFKNTIYEYESIDTILVTLLKYIDASLHLNFKNPSRKRDTALNKAVEIISSLEDSVFSISQLCADTNVSERTLEYAFKERYQVSPSEYIKANRLHKVKNELIISKNNETSITDIAGKYGFWHMGQFAKDFKNLFGVVPSQI